MATETPNNQTIISPDVPNPILRVFVSHFFEEEPYAVTLVNALKSRRIAGYMAQKVKKYEIGIDQKIKEAILASDYLVPVLTNNGLGSPSINQEIGFAIAKDVPVISMMEQATKAGVFTHGREPEGFTKETFQQACSNVADYLASEGRRRVKTTPTGKPAEEILTKRRLVDPEREEFTINPISYLARFHNEEGTSSKYCQASNCIFSMSKILTG